MLPVSYVIRPPAIVRDAQAEELLRRRHPLARVQPWPLGDCPLLLCRLAEDARCSRPGPGRLLPPSSADDVAAARSELRTAVLDLCTLAATPAEYVARTPAKVDAVEWMRSRRREGSDTYSESSERGSVEDAFPRGNARVTFQTGGSSSSTAGSRARPRGARAVEGLHFAAQLLAYRGLGGAQPAASAGPRAAEDPLGWSPERWEAAELENRCEMARRARGQRFAPLATRQSICWLEWLEAVQQLARREAGWRPLPALRDDSGRERLLQAAHALLLEGQPAPELRPAVWLWLAARGGRREQLHPGGYAGLCAQAPRDAAGQEAEQALSEQIQRDLSRTAPELFMGPGHSMHRGMMDLSVPAFERMQAVRRMLIAFSRHRPEIGYCQGLNFVAAVLIGLLDEASAFVVFCDLVSRLPHDLYSRDPDRLHACRCEMHGRVAAALAKELPDLARHLGKLALDLNFFLPKWLSVLFASVLPPPATLRLWDLVLGPVGGAAPSCLALALLQRARGRLLAAADIEQALQVLGGVVEEVSEADVETMLLKEWPDSRFERALRSQGEPGKEESVYGDSVSDKSEGQENTSTAVGSSFNERAQSRSIDEE